MSDKEGERLDDCLARLSRLEKQNVWLKKGLICLSVLGSTLLLVAAQEKPRKVEVESFILRGKDGKARAILTVVDDNPTFQLLDKKQNPRVALNLIKDEPSIHILNGKPLRQLALLIDRGTPILEMGDERGKVRARLSAPRDQGTLFILADEQGNIGAKLEVSQKDTGFSLLHRTIDRAKISVLEDKTTIGLMNKLGVCPRIPLSRPPRER